MTISSSTQAPLPELLAPAGSFEKLVTAIHYGADAVYLGGKSYSLRARAGNFDDDELRQAIAYAHAHSVRVYVTVNIFAHNRDMAELPEYLLLLRDAGADGLIISDPGILAQARQLVPEIPIHLSTQANVTNTASARFWADQGVVRLNLARELGLKEIQEIRSGTDVELEVFVHGALCISYSGRCMLSSYFTGRNANQGDCAQPCRYSYAVVEEKRPGQYFPVEEDDHGTYIFNSKDLCLLNQLPRLVGAGVHALKIEGRMKAAGYVGAVVRVYRLALDWIGEQLRDGKNVAALELPPLFMSELAKTGTRGQTENFFTQAPAASDMLYKDMRIPQQWVPAGIVCNTVRMGEPLCIDVRHQLCLGEQVELLGRTLAPDQVTITSMIREDGTPLTLSHPGQRIFMRIEPMPAGLEEHTILRKQVIS